MNDDYIENNRITPMINLMHILNYYKKLSFFANRKQLKKFYIWKLKLNDGRILLKPGITFRNIYTRIKEYKKEHSFIGEVEIIFIGLSENYKLIEKEFKKALKKFPLNNGQHGNTEQFIFNDDTKAIIIKNISKFFSYKNNYNIKEFYINEEYKSLITQRFNCENKNNDFDVKNISEKKFINKCDFYKLPDIRGVPKHKKRWNTIMRFKNQNGPFKSIDDFCSNIINCSYIGQIIKKNVSLVLKETFRKLKPVLS